MDYSIPCPECGHKHTYFSHEIGSTAECAKCRAKFPLPEQPGRVIGYLLWAAVVVILIVVWLILDLTNILR